jgi:putative ABC transport system permease protein
MLEEIRHLVRALRNSPGFTAASVLTLALGIGATTTIFSLIDGVLLRPLAYPNPERLYVIHEAVPNGARIPVNAGHFERWRAATRSFEGLALLRPVTVNLTGRGEPEPVSLVRASAALFPMLGVRAQAGRLFLEEEDRAGRDRVVVLSDGFWRRRFDGDLAVIGQSITLDGEPYDVIGILPPQFRFPKVGLLYETPTASADPQIWKPFGARDFELFPVGNFNFAAVGRLALGVSVEQALEDLNVVQAEVGRTLQTSFRTAWFRCTSK